MGHLDVRPTCQKPLSSEGAGRNWTTLPNLYTLGVPGYAASYTCKTAVSTGTHLVISIGNSATSLKGGRMCDLKAQPMRRLKRRPLLVVNKL
jgi:hypothetical protein